jgi:DNA-binding HxlR family transcriptional regulator
VIGDWWSLLIVRDAFFGKRRFGEIQESRRTAILKLVQHVTYVNLR